MSGFRNRVLYHPLVPAIALIYWCVRIWSVEITWSRALGIAGCVVWLFMALKNWRSRGTWLDSLDAEAETPRKPVATAREPGTPEPGTPEYVAYMRTAIAHVKEIHRRAITPPPSPPTEAEIRATARPAIAMKLDALPVPLDHPGRSYVGGLPRLPAEIPWPEKHVGDESWALTFLAQVDLAELPPIESLGLPNSGTLYFFSDTTDSAPGLNDGRVLYYPGDTVPLPLREPPSNVRPYGCGGEPWPWLAESSVWAKTSFRFLVEFAKCDSFRDHYLEADTMGPPPRNEKVFNNLMGGELVRCFGPVENDATDVRGILREDREEWLFAWVVIEYGARAIERATREVLRRKEAAEAAAVYRRIGRAATRWIERAALETAHAPPNVLTRVAFHNEWRQLVEEFSSTSKRLKIYGVNPADQQLQVLLASCYFCASQDAIEVIPAVFRDALWNTNSCHPVFAQHQMLGHGLRVQWAPIQHAHQVLLLQLAGDARLGWHSNVGCVLQFWIDGQALEQRAFQTAELTLECD